MKKNLSALAILSVITFGGIAVVACSDDSSTATGTSSGNPLNPDSGSSGSSGSSGTSGTSGSSGTDGGCPSNPAGCFCGTPTTQAEFLNRCTNAVALPVNLTFTPATTTDIP